MRNNKFQTYAIGIKELWEVNDESLAIRNSYSQHWMATYIIMLMVVHSYINYLIILLQ